MFLRLNNVFIEEQELLNESERPNLFEAEESWSPSHLYDAEKVNDSGISSEEYFTFVSYGILIISVIIILFYGSYRLFYLKNMKNYAKKDEDLSDSVAPAPSTINTVLSTQSHVQNKESVIRLTTIDPSVLSIHDSAII